MPEHDEDGFTGKCDICGEPYNCLSNLDSEIAAEFHDPNKGEYIGIIAHPDCAQNRGLVMS